MNKKLFKMAKASDRELRIEAGFFDGRFAPKQFTDRKKKSKRLACRKWKLNKQEY